MDRKTYTIGILSITAVILFIAQFLPIRPNAAMAADSVRDRDYSMVTSRASAGGENLYVVENRTGMMAVFSWDSGARALVLRAIRPVGDAFQQP